MSLAKLHPVLYPGRCRVALPALDRGGPGRDAAAFLAHYKSAELDVRIRPAGIDELAVLCGVKPGSIGVQLNAFDELELADVDAYVDADANADALQQGIQ